MTEPRRFHAPSRPVAGGRRGRSLRDALGFCLWLLSFPLLLGLVLLSRHWLRLPGREGAVLAAALAAVIGFLWLRFIWTRVVRRPDRRNDCA